MAAHDENHAPAGAAGTSIETTDDGRHAVVSVPGTTEHHKPGERAAATRQSLADERLDAAEHVTAAIPRGDTEALDEVRRHLHTDDARAAGATVIVEGSTQPPDADDGS